MKRVGLDVGFGWTKVVTDEAQFKFRSLVASYPESGESDVRPVVVMGRSYLVGEDAKYGRDVRTISNISSYLDYLPVLTRASVVEAGLEGEKIAAVVGLPPIYKEYKSKVEESLKSIGIETFVVPQGYGILKDVEDRIENDVLILDIGFNTVDYLIARRGSDGWVKVRSNTVEGLGVQKAVSIFVDRVAREYPFIQREPIGKKAFYFEKAGITIEGQKVDLGQEKEAAIGVFIDEVLNRLDEELALKNLFNQVEAVVVAGGGAHIIPANKVPHPNLIIPEAPEFSQARGYYKVACKVFTEGRDESAENDIP